MKILFSSLLGLCLLGASGEALSNAAINRYLEQARDMVTFGNEEQSAETGWIDEAELRYSGSDQQEYGLAFRFRPQSPSERSAGNRIMTLLDRQLATLRNDYLSNDLKQRYYRLIDMVELASDLQHLENRSSLSQQTLQARRSLVQTENFRIADLQSAELDHQRNQQQLQAAQQRLETRLYSFDGLASAQVENFLANWPQQISHWDNFLITGNELLEQANNFQLQTDSDRVDFQLAQQELLRARGESRSWLRYVELKWVDRPSGDQETSIGFSIPLSRNRLDVSERVAAFNRASISLQANREKLSDMAIRFVSELEWQRQQARFLRSGIELLEQQIVKLGVAQQPLLLIDLQREVLDYRYQIERNHIRHLRNYIDLLHEVGYLARTPLVNWLLRDQPRLGQ